MTQETGDVRFEYLPSKKVMLKNEENVIVTISKAFGQMLGFKENYHPTTAAFHISKTVKSSFTADINQGKHHLYVYCDIVQPHIVGDVKVHL